MHLSRIGYYSDFFVYPVLIALLAIAGLGFAGTEGAAIWLAMFAACVALWTLIEYLMHRFVLHHVPYIKDMHNHHHHEEKASVGTPTWLSVSSHAAIVFIPALLLSNFVTASAVSGGLMLGYLWYISIHHALHHWHPSHSTYFYGLKRRHALHHHFDDAGNFGVTTNFWDRVFGTMITVNAAAMAQSK